MLSTPSSAVMPSQEVVAERNVFAIINTKSGERAAAEFVLEQLREVLSERRREQLKRWGEESRDSTTTQYPPMPMVGSSSSSTTATTTGGESQQQHLLYKSTRPDSVVHVLAFEKKTWRTDAVAFLRDNIRRRRRKSQQGEGGGGGGESDELAAMQYSAASPTVPIPANQQQQQQQERRTLSNSLNHFNNATGNASSSPRHQQLPPVENILIVAGGDGTVALAADLLNETGALLLAKPQKNGTAVSSSAHQHARRESNPLPFPLSRRASDGTDEGQQRESEEEEQMGGDERTNQQQPPPSAASGRLHQQQFAATTSTSMQNVSYLTSQSLFNTANHTSYTHEDFSLHIAVIPMGTGNDLSRSLGFGPGFVRGVGPCDGCQMSSMRPIIDETIGGRVIGLDLWTMGVKPLLGAGAIIGGASGKGMLMPTATTASTSVTSPEDATQQPSPDSTSAVVTTTQRFNFVNYFSVGFDARICTEFHHFRTNHPKLCSTRIMNKAWYGLLGIKTLIGEPVIKAKYVTLTVDGRRTPIPSDVKSIVISNVVSFAGGVQLWSDPSATKVYKDAKGNVVRSGPQLTSSEWFDAEVDGESAEGATIASALGGDGMAPSFTVRPAGNAKKKATNSNNANNINDGNNNSNSSPAATTQADGRPAGTYEPASVGDGLLEVQGLYGSLHMSMLQLKARHSVKIAQGRVIEMTIMYPQLLELYNKAAAARRKEFNGRGDANQNQNPSNFVSIDENNRGQQHAAASSSRGGSEYSEPITPTVAAHHAPPSTASANNGDGGNAATPTQSSTATTLSSTSAQSKPLVAAGKLPPPSLTTPSAAASSTPSSSGVVVSEKEINALPPPLATQLDGEAMPAIEAMLKEYGAITLLITRRQEASMLSLAQQGGGGGNDSSTTAIKHAAVDDE